MLAEKFGFTYKPHVTLLGIGMGSRETLTIQGKEAVEKQILLSGQEEWQMPCAFLIRMFL